MEASTIPEKKRRRVPIIDLIQCSDCETCLDLCPEVFHRNPETGRIEVEDLSIYPEETVREAIAHCPKDCIDWEDT